ncbi:hypothetical protein JB92DRAFT_3133847 [Gautieria morchelliformis]|nr:hypothetical protein JB92DRAFT_3133847 [Gautieria morchelliformis]
MPLPEGEPFAPPWTDSLIQKAWPHWMLEDRKEWLAGNPPPSEQPSADTTTKGMMKTHTRIRPRPRPESCSDSPDDAPPKRRKVSSRVKGRRRRSCGGKERETGNEGPQAHDGASEDGTDLPSDIDGLMKTHVANHAISQRPVDANQLQDALDPALARADEEVRMECWANQVAKAVSGQMASV